MSAPRRRSRNAPPLTAAFDLRAYRHPAGYVRVSTDEQAEDGTSIGVQIRQLRAFAAAQGLELADGDIYVDDGWSGKDLNRPAMVKLRADVQAGLVDCVLVTKLDRLSRNLRDMVNLCLGDWQDEAPERGGAVLKSISEPFDTCTDFGRMVFGLLAMFAEFERRRIADRTWSGKTSRAEAGRNAGHRAPYGFRLVPAPDGRGSSFAVVPEEAAVIRRITEMYLQGCGDQQIAGRLNEEGLRFRDGALWQSRQVGRILRNHLIIGIYTYGRTSITPDGAAVALPEEQWVFSREAAVPEATIEPGVFRQIQELRAARRTAGRAPGGMHVLAGLVRCGRCGSACAVKRSGPAGRYRYYRCLRRKQSGRTACTQPALRADHLEAQLLAAITAVMEAAAGELQARLHASTSARLQGLMQQRADLAREEARLTEVRDRYFEWLESGQMRPEAVRERLDQLAGRQAELAEARQRVEAEIAAGQEATEPGLLQPGWFALAWAGLHPQERRRLAGLLVAGVELDGNSLFVTWRHDLHPAAFVAE